MPFPMGRAKNGILDIGLAWKWYDTFFFLVGFDDVVPREGKTRV